MKQLIVNWLATILRCDELCHATDVISALHLRKKMVVGKNLKSHMRLSALARRNSLVSPSLDLTKAKGLRVRFNIHLLVFGIGLYGLMLLSSCQKIEYTVIDSPAYLRVFNSLNTQHTMEAKGDTLSYLAMLINPELDGNGIPVGADILGDFLDQRDGYAPPYPSHIGVSTSQHNPEYPGKENVLVGPVLNGFDLSSWAQVPSGQLRVMFVYRPKNSVGFFDLSSDFRKDILIDTILNLESQEVYTLNVVLKDMLTREKTIVMRQELFHKIPLSDSLVYINFYNYSAKGFVDADISHKTPTGSRLRHLFQQGIRDTMNVFISLYKGQQDFINERDGIILQNSTVASPYYFQRYFTTLRHNNFSESVSEYVSFPLWVRDDEDGISTDLWQRLYFLSPGANMDQNPFDEHAAFYNSLDGGLVDNANGNFAAINFLRNGPKIYVPEASCVGCNIYRYHAGLNFPNLVVSIHSGEHNPRSFATINTVEVINGQAYLMTIQRQYAPPVLY